VAIGGYLENRMSGGVQNANLFTGTVNGSGQKRRVRSNYMDSINKMFNIYAEEMVYRGMIDGLEPSISAEKNMEKRFICYLRASGQCFGLESQVKHDFGVADVCTDFAIYELKHTINKQTLATGIGQLLGAGYCFPDKVKILVFKKSDLGNTFYPLLEKYKIFPMLFEI